MVIASCRFLYKWPADSEIEMSWNARKACLEALQGQGDAAAARQAFKDAAEEAGILIGDAFRPSPPSPKSASDSATPRSI
jgi:hypothetical protein